MKRVNLIPVERQKGVLTKSWLRKRLRNPRFRLISASVIGFVVVSHLWNTTAVSRYRRQISAKSKLIEELETESATLKIQTEEIQEEKELVNNQISRLKKKLIFLDKERKEGYKWSPILVQISNLIPKEVWVNKISLDKDVIIISGTTVNSNLISKFMVALEERGYFRDTTFNYTQRTKLDDKNVMKFEVLTRLKGKASERLSGSKPVKEQEGSTGSDHRHHKGCLHKDTQRLGGEHHHNGYNDASSP